MVVQAVPTDVKMLDWPQLSPLVKAHEPFGPQHAPTVFVQREEGHVDASPRNVPAVAPVEQPMAVLTATQTPAAWQQAPLMARHGSGEQTVP